MEAKNEETIMDETEMEEVRMMEHNRRFQAAVLRTMDTQLEQMETQLLDQETELIASERARTDLGLAFGVVKRELIKIKGTSDKQAKQWREAVDARKVIGSERDRLRTDNDRLMAENKKLKRLTDEHRDAAARAKHETHQIKQVHKVYASDMAVYKQLNENLRKEVISVGRKEKDDEGRLISMNREMSKKAEELYQAKLEIIQQENETKKAQAALERAAHELHMTTEAKKLLTVQMEKAMRAMSQRDEQTRVLNNARQKAEDELQLAKQMERTLLAQNSTLTMQLDRVTSTQTRAQSDMNEFLGEFTRTKEEFETQKQQLMATQQELERTQQELQSISTKYGHAKDVMATQKNRERVFAEEKGKLKHELLREAHAQEKAAQAALKQIDKREEALDKELRNKQSRLINVENERQAEKYKSLELERDVGMLSTENNTLNTEMKTLINKYNQAQNQIHQLEDDVERLTYRANKAEAEAKTLHNQLLGLADNAEAAVKNDLTALEKQLRQKKEEYASVNAAFVRTQEHVVAAQMKLGNISDNRNKLQSRLTVQEQVNEQLSRETKAQKVSLADNEKELALTHLDLKKAHDVIIKLKEEKQSLLKKVEDAAFVIKAKSAEHEKQKSEWNARVASQRGDRIDHGAMLKELYNTNNTTERKYQEMKFKYANLSKEHEMMAQRVFALKDELKKTQVSHVEADRQYQAWAGQFEAIFAREVKDRGQRIHNIRENARHSTALPDLLKEHDKLRKREHVPALAKKAFNKATRWTKENQHSRNRHTGPQTARDARVRNKANRANRTEELFRAKSQHSQARQNKFVDTLVHELRKELNRISTIAAERLNEIVNLKQNLKDVSFTANQVHEQKATFQHVVQKSLKDKQQAENALHRMQNKYLRASSLAASLEQQLHSLIERTQEMAMETGKKPDDLPASVDLKFSPDVQASEALRRVIEDETASKEKSKEQASLFFQHHVYDDPFSVNMSEAIADEMTSVSLSKFIHTSQNNQNSMK